jgi:hypothetical protein
MEEVREAIGVANLKRAVAQMKAIAQIMAMQAEA